MDGGFSYLDLHGLLDAFGRLASVTSVAARIAPSALVAALGPSADMRTNLLGTPVVTGGDRWS